MKDEDVLTIEEELEIEAYLDTLPYRSEPHVYREYNGSIVIAGNQTIH